MTHHSSISPVLCWLCLWLVFVGLFPAIGPSSVFESKAIRHPKVISYPNHRKLRREHDKTVSRSLLASSWNNETETKRPLLWTIYSTKQPALAESSNDVATRSSSALDNDDDVDDDSINNTFYPSAAIMSMSKAANDQADQDAKRFGIAALALACGFVCLLLAVGLFVFRDHLWKGINTDLVSGDAGNCDEAQHVGLPSAVAEAPTRGRSTIVWHDPLAGESQDVFVGPEAFASAFPDEKPSSQPQMFPPAAILGRRSSSGLRRVRFQLPPVSFASIITSESVIDSSKNTVTAHDDVDDDEDIVHPVHITVEQTDYIASSNCCSAAHGYPTQVNSVIASVDDPTPRRRNNRLCNHDSWVDRIMHPLWDTSVCCPEPHDTSNSTFTSMSSTSHHLSLSFESATSDTPFLHRVLPTNTGSSSAQTDPSNKYNDSNDKNKNSSIDDYDHDDTDDDGYDEEEIETEDSMSDIAAVLGIQRLISTESEDNVTVLEVGEEQTHQIPMTDHRTTAFTKKPKSGWRTRQWWNGIRTATAHEDGSSSHNTKSNSSTVFDDEFDLESMGGTAEQFGSSRLAEI